MHNKTLCLIGVFSFGIMFYVGLSHLAAETIQLQRQDGTYMVPVQINGAVTLPFTLDTGAAPVAIPEDVFLTLLRTGTVKMRTDFVGTGTAVLADGSKQASKLFVLHEVRVGDHVVKNVIASVISVKGDPLLGQSFLSKLPSWTIDNERHALVLNDQAGSIGGAHQSPRAVPSALESTPPARSGEPNLSAEELVERGRKAQADKNYSEAMRWYQMAAAEGNFAAAHNIGVLYLNGLGVSQNYTEAMHWLLIAANKGRRESQYNIGALYERGLGVAQDYVEGMRWYRMAAVQGLGLAQYRVGVLYSKGQGVAQDYSEAMRWWQMAAEKGNADAQAGVGALYAQGLGVRQDFAQAMRWYQTAAAQRNAVAQYNIGVLYHNGSGVTRDPAEAMRWYQMAAAQGYSLAQNNIGSMVAHGEATSKDCTVAKQWLERAAAAGVEIARKNLISGVNGVCPWSVVR
jgi:clan AA aspartic protease (TIGR02281 family)